MQKTFHIPIIRYEIKGVFQHYECKFCGAVFMHHYTRHSCVKKYIKEKQNGK